MRPEIRTHLFSALFMAVLVILQVSVVPLMHVLGATPSLPLIGIAFIAMRHGSTPAMFYAFPSGLMIDAYIGEVVGISSLALTTAAFAMGFFHDAEKSALLIRSGKAVGIVLLGAVIFCVIYVFAYFRTLDFDIISILLRHVAGAAAYTALLSTIPVLILARSGSRLKV
ncbi:MAG: rod shape-determining protein MreD [Bacteroidetes bacterium]|nr:rod shape-determining protein MreD [Bacteroidota bacterium]